MENLRFRLVAGQVMAGRARMWKICGSGWLWAKLWRGGLGCGKFAVRAGCGPSYGRRARMWKICGAGWLRAKLWRSGLGCGKFVVRSGCGPSYGGAG